MALFNIISARQFAEETGVDYDTVRRLCREGKLPRLLVGKGGSKKRSFRLPREEAIEALKALMNAPVEVVEMESGELRPVVKAKTYKPRRVSAAAAGFDFEKELRNLC